MEFLLFTGTYLLSIVFIRAIGLSPLARLFIDKPDHRKLHQAAVPRYGGIAIILAFLAVLGILHAIGMPWPYMKGTLPAAMAFVSVFLLVAGGLDDAKPLNYKVKFALQFAMAGGVVFLLGRDFDTIAVLGYRFELGIFGPLLSVFWIVALMNAMNIIDGIDGLAGGVFLFAIGTVAFLCHANGADGRLMICLALMGATAGFLRFNFSRHHKIFLGDAGSQFLGAMVALMAMEVQAMPKTGYSFFVPLFIVGYPLLDISVAMVRRFKCGSRRGLGRRILRMFAADNEHLHHRLVYLGLSHVQSTFLLLMVAGGIGATGVIISRLGWPYRPMVMGYLVVALMLILNRLGFIGPGPWLTFPRVKAMPSRIVGVIQPDELFMHSLKSFKQDKFEFLGIPEKLTRFMGEDLLSVVLYNGDPERFESQWTLALRATEFQNCPAVVIADPANIDRVRSSQPGGFSNVHFIEKPVRVPELIRLLEYIAKGRDRLSRTRPRERRFSLAELALKSRNDAGQ